MKSPTNRVGIIEPEGMRKGSTRKERRINTAKMTGKKEVLGIKLDPEAITPDDPELLEDLITAAVNLWVLSRGLSKGIEVIAKIERPEAVRNVREILAVIRDLSEEHRGLVLVTGPSGSGRGTAIKVLEDLGFEAETESLSRKERHREPSRLESASPSPSVPPHIHERDFLQSHGIT